MTSSAAKAAIYAPQTDEVFLVLITLDHPDLADPLRFAGNTQDIVSRGDTYTGFPFEVVLPTRQSDQLARAQIRIYADPSVVKKVRGLSSAPSLKLEVIMASEPNTVQSGPFDFTLQNARTKAGAIAGELAYEDMLAEPYPGDIVTPATVPGLF